MLSHDPRIAPHDWRMTSRCPRCRGPVFETRRPGNYGRQTDCRAWCRALQREERAKGRGT